MIYGYLQIADKAGASYQRDVIESYARNKNLQIEGWLTDEKELAASVLKKGDLLLLENWTRLGADIIPIMATMKELLSEGVILCSCADSATLGGDMATPVLINVFELMSRIAVQTRSERTKEGLRKSRQAGKVLGRKAGTRNKNSRLDGKEAEITALLASGVGKGRIAKIMHVDYYNFKRFLRNGGIFSI